MNLPRGKYIRNRVGEPATDEAEHFIKCPPVRGLPNSALHSRRASQRKPHDIMQFALETLVNLDVSSLPAGDIERIAVPDVTARPDHSVLRLSDLNISRLTVELQQEEARYQRRSGEHGP